MNLQNPCRYIWAAPYYFVAPLWLSLLLAQRHLFRWLCFVHTTPGSGKSQAHELGFPC